MKIGIIGAGIVGGATGRVLSQKHEVFYYDKYKAGIDSESHIEKIAQDAEMMFLCVPTPMKPGGEMDYTAMYNSLDNLLTYVNKSNRNPRELICVIKSTAVSGTTDKLAQHYPFVFAFSPEFLREKYAEEDMKNTSRVVIGANDSDVSKKIINMYLEVFPKAQFECFDIKTAEMIKCAANVMLASQIALANELHKICSAVGVDYNLVKESILHDARIAKNINVPGHDGEFGFGGKCFPKDLNALLHLARANGVKPQLFEEVWRSNLLVRTKKDWLDIPGATTQTGYQSLR